MSTQPDNIAMNIIDILDLGVSPFKEVWDLQKELVKKRQNGQINDTLILVEHEPVYTLGKNADENHILQHTPRNVKTYQIERGGDVTFHGPGQLVGYPILDLHNYKKSISWYMRRLNETVARLANDEDNCTGHFWEARYKSQALMTEEALLSCMAYVDLNPIRAGMAKTPEESDHTSIKERIAPCFNAKQAMCEQEEFSPLRYLPRQVKSLARFEGNEASAGQNGILFSLIDYLKLIDYTGRMVSGNKRGSIALHLPPILERLGTGRKQWIEQCTQFERIYQTRFGRRRKSRDQRCA